MSTVERELSLLLVTSEVVYLMLYLLGEEERAVVTGIAVEVREDGGCGGTPEAVEKTFGGGSRSVFVQLSGLRGRLRLSKGTCSGFDLGEGTGDQATPLVQTWGVA
jgi:hypothetical protein